MRAIPAIDLREGRCVQLVGGDYTQEAVRRDDPLEVARHWVTAGFHHLHLVDLDAATGRGDNREVLRELILHAGVPVQVGGGIRDTDAIESWLDAGADRLIIGTRGVEDHRWLEEQAEQFPGQLILAADVRKRTVVSRGWTADTAHDILDFIQERRDLPLAGLLVTAVEQEGRMQGTDLPLMADVVDVSPWPVLASGGVGSMQDLRALEDRGVAAAVLGMSLYTETLDPRVVAEEFNT